MDIQAYFTKLNEESQGIFNKVVLERENLGLLHHYSSCVYEFSECIPDPKEKDMFVKVCVQLESATFNMSLGLYRQAFSSLRLAFEMGLAAVYFSINKLELHEWLDGRADIRWSTLIDENDGVLSKRFSNAFFSECSEHTEEYRQKAKSTYRDLSEYVHGNNETWDKSGLKLCHDEQLSKTYLDRYKAVLEVILFSSICRYAKLFDESSLESLQFVPEEFNHISAIRDLFGRS